MSERDEVKQFNVYLPVELIRALKHHAIDTEASLSSIVATALGEFLEKHKEPYDDRQRR